MHHDSHEEPYRPDPIHTHAEHLENEDNHVAHEEVMNVPIETEATASMKAEVTTAAIPTHHTEEDVEDIDDGKKEDPPLKRKLAPLVNLPKLKKMKNQRTTTTDMGKFALFFSFFFLFFSFFPFFFLIGVYID